MVVQAYITYTHTHNTGAAAVSWNFPRLCPHEWPGEEAPSVRDDMQALEKRLVDGLARLDDELCEVRSRESRREVVVVTAAAAGAHPQIAVILALFDAADERPGKGGAKHVLSPLLMGREWLIAAVDFFVGYLEGLNPSC